MIYDLLKAVGYRVGIFSSQDEDWGQMINYLRTPSVDKLVHANTWRGPKYLRPEDDGFSAWATQNRRGGNVDDRFTVGQSIQWIDQADPRPFFVYLNLQSSHFPYTLPADYPRRFGPAKVDFTMSFTYYPPGAEKTVADMYDDSLNYADAQLAKLFDHLKANGLWDRTLIVLTGDHGESFNQHNLRSHANSVFQEVLLVPMVMRAPGLAPAVIDGPAESVDIPPTILHLLHLPPHPAYQGYDLLSPDRPRNRSIYAMVHTPLTREFALVRGPYKYIYDQKRRQGLLFDLTADPLEMKNLVAVQPQLADEMRERLDTWRAVQLQYYGNALRESRWYPPVMPEN